MRAIKKRAIQLKRKIDKYRGQLAVLLSYELTRPDKAFDIFYDGIVYEFSPSTTQDEMDNQARLASELSYRIISDCITLNDWTNVIALVSGEDPADHQFEIIKEEIVYNLDAEGNPISAKPLNEDSVYVQWQDQNKFNFEESK